MNDDLPPLPLGLAEIALRSLFGLLPPALAAEAAARQEEDSHLASLRALTSLPVDEIRAIAARDPGGYQAVRERVLSGGPVEYHPYWQLEQWARAYLPTPVPAPLIHLDAPPRNRAERRAQQRKRGKHG